MANTAGVGILVPESITAKGASDLLRQYWSNETYMESLKVDVLMNIPYLTNPVDPGKDRNDFSLKEGYVFHDITPPGKDMYARSVRLQLTKSLSGAATEGTVGTLLGAEEDIQVKQFSVFANDWAHAVTTQTYGINYRENAPTKVYELAKPELAQWLGEYLGWNARMALLERISNNLTVAPISLTTAWNQNWYVAGLAAGSQPVYSEVDATHEDNILAALDAVTPSASHLTVSEILQIEEVAHDKFIKPIYFEGKELYFLYVAAEEYKRLRDSAVTGSFGEYWQQAAALPASSLDKVIPSDKFVMGDGIVVCRDRRAAALGTSPDPTPTTLNSYYNKQGRNDERVGIADALKWNVNMLLGQHALVKFNPEKPHYEEQYDEYKKFKGIGYAGACSYMLPAFDLDTKTATSVQQEGSMVVSTERTAA